MRYATPKLILHFLNTLAVRVQHRNVSIHITNQENIKRDTSSIGILLNGQRFDLYWNDKGAVWWK